MKVSTCLLFLALVVGRSLHADVTLPAIFGDHMVLQQGSVLPIWGKASPGERVVVTFGGESAQSVAASDGSWRVLLHPIPATRKSMTLLVEGRNHLKIDDVMVGDVWICAGEGNMEFPLSDAVGGKELPGDTADPYLHFFLAENSSTGDEVGAGHWVLCTPESAPSFSAVGYFFARDLRNVCQRPIGMIQCTAKDAPIQSWISPQGLSAAPSVSKEGEKPASALRDQKSPSALFNAMIAPLIPYAMTGVIWYQGESDEGMASLQYRRFFSRLIRDWRNHWKAGPQPFYFVLPAGFGDEDGPVVEPFAGDSHQPSRALPWLREGAACALTLPNTGMACATDLGLADDRYPPDKLDVGRRLALLARKRAYGEDVVDSGPTFDSMRIEGSRMRVKFSHLGSGLILGASPFQREEVAPSISTRLSGFALAGANRKWFPANAVIEKDSVLLSSDAVMHPVAVRYNWQGFPKGNLYNREGLPAPPFRTDETQPDEFPKDR
jgi:sialate O-acetylesterase